MRELGARDISQDRFLPSFLEPNTYCVNAREEAWEFGIKKALMFYHAHLFSDERNEDFFLGKLANRITSHKL